MSLEKQQLKNILEAALLASGQALSIDRIMSLFVDNMQPTRDEVRDVLNEIAEDCEPRGIELKQVSSGYRFQAKQDYSDWVSRLWEEKPPRYSRALLETMVLIAYRQPITRGEIEDVRGVSVSTHIVKTLLEREWVRVVGHRDVPGKPALYATTKAFLDYFNLKSLEELPTLAEIRDLDKINAEFELDEPDPDKGSIPESMLEIEAEALKEAEEESMAAENESGTESETTIDENTDATADTLSEDVELSEDNELGEENQLSEDNENIHDDVVEDVVENEVSDSEAEAIAAQTDTDVEDMYETITEETTDQGHETQSVDDQPAIDSTQVHNTVDDESAGESLADDETNEASNQASEENQETLYANQQETNAISEEPNDNISKQASAADHTAQMTVSEDAEQTHPVSEPSNIES